MTDARTLPVTSLIAHDEMERSRTSADIQDALRGYLRVFAVGKGRAIKQAELRTELHCNEPALSAAITELRLKGEPICTGDPGVWYCANADEWGRCMAWLKLRASKVEKVLRAMEHTEQRLFKVEQGKLFP